ncbi:MAG: VOC family protein [Candidatus Bathyarchaeota archaeon]
MFKEIEHVEIITPNLEESIKFYTEIIGFKIINRKKIGTHGISELAHLSLNESRLELIEMREAAPVLEHPHIGYRMMALIVDDMDDAIKLLKANNVKITREPRSMNESDRGGFRGEFQDNNGVTIEIRQLAK